MPVGGYLGVAASLLLAASIGAETEGPRPLGGLVGIVVLLLMIWGFEGFSKLFSAPNPKPTQSTAKIGLDQNSEDASRVTRRESNPSSTTPSRQTNSGENRQMSGNPDRPNKSKNKAASRNNSESDENSSSGLVHHRPTVRQISSIVNTPNQNSGEEKLEPSDEDHEAKRWEAFISYSSISNEVISSLWDKGKLNYCAFDYLSELRKFIQTKDKITETRDEIIDAVVQNTDKNHKISEAKDIQLLYHKIRYSNPKKAEELRSVIEFLGDGADITKLTEKFDADKVEFPLLGEIDLSNLESSGKVETNSNFHYKDFEIKLNSNLMYEVFERGEKIGGTKQFMLPDQARAFVDQYLYEASSNY